MKKKITVLVFIVVIISCHSKAIEAVPEVIEPVAQVSVASFPKDYQLYARDANNKALITINGAVDNSIDSLITRVHRKNGVITRTAITARGSFSLNIEIEALLHNYTISLFSKSMDGDELHIKTATHVTAGDVYVINGQSNAWAIDYDNAYNYNDLPPNAQWVRTIGAMHVYNQTAISPEAENTDWFMASGKAPDIRGGAQLVGNGMVGVLGINIGINLVESENVPIAIINGGGGGGAISFYQKTSNNNLNVPYGRLQYRLENSDLKNKIKAFIWNQGENNAGDTTLAYKNALNQLYDSFINDYTFEKFYIIQTPPGCNSSTGHQAIREAQRQFAKENENVRILTRHGFSLNPNQSDGNYFLLDGCHYHAHGYEVLANWISNLARYDFYGETVNYEAPKVTSVQFESSASLAIEFDKEIAIQPDMQVDDVLYTAKDNLFAVNGERTTAISTLELLPGNKKIRLTFTGQNISVGDKLTHILDDNYPTTSMPFRGPWIVDAVIGVGAVGFTEIIE